MPPSPNIRWAISSISLGKHASHTLERKLAAASANHFSGLELVFTELVAHAAAHNQPLLASAAHIAALSASHGLTILSLNAFKSYDGNLAVSLEERLANARLWCDIAVALRTRVIQVPSMFLHESTGDLDVVVRELQALADLAAEYGLEIAYEAVAFARHYALWQDSVRIARAVDRPNFRVCLDSYHIHARLWGDACAADGRIAGGNEVLGASMRELVEECPKELVSYVQLSDAARWDPPLAMDDVGFEGLEVREPTLLWSRVARPFPLEGKGYFPVVDVARTWLVEWAWDGWVSLEGFLRETEREDVGPEEMARRGRESIERLMARLQ